MTDGPVTYDELVADGVAAVEWSNNINWRLGDLALVVRRIMAEDRKGTKVVSTFCAEIGFSEPDRLQQMATVSEAFPDAWDPIEGGWKFLRGIPLSWSHFRVAAPYPVGAVQSVVDEYPTKGDIIRLAFDNGWSHTQLARFLKGGIDAVEKEKHACETCGRVHVVADPH